MAELIYCVKNIFNKSDLNGCLAQHNTEKYLIPSYQRGYKWSSEENGAVSILLNDLKKAFDAKKKEYYLQYITVKETEELGEKVLELIDGQQRLTTLSIFVAVATNALQTDDFANELLDYEVRGDFFQPNIHNRDALNNILCNQSNDDWKNLQDSYYIISAARKMHEFLQSIEESSRKEFVYFVFDQVKIIVNVVDRGDSERVFANLNSNKVNLTEAELIKGILLTKVSRGDDKQKRFREITEERMKLGLQWDEMSRWCNDRKVCSFYFNSAKDGMTELMKFSASRLGADIKTIEKQNAKEYPLFNFYLEQSEHQKSYEMIVNSYRILKDLYEDTETYNLLGYLLSIKGTQYKSCVHLLYKNLLQAYFNGEKDRVDIKRDLLKEIKDNLKISKQFGQLEYGEDSDIIHHILLAINVFEPNVDEKRLSKVKFDFYSFKTYNWTLEHIFPQTPEGKGQSFSTKEKEEIKNMISTISDQGLKERVNDILDKGYSTDSTTCNEEKEIVKNALDMVVNNIGNMCLLTSKDNPSNGNKFFEDKRSNILNRITHGSFVPKHTFEVFSKSIFPDNPGGLDLWGKSDKENHCKIMEDRIKFINDFNY